MKRTTTIILAVMICLFLFSACQKAEETEPEAPSVSTAKAVSSEAKDFRKWTATDIVNYFKAEGVFSNDDYLAVYTDKEEIPEGLSALISYDDIDEGRETVLILQIEDESIYRRIEETKSIRWNEYDNEQPFNTLIGRFAVFYSASSDKAFISKFETALDELIEDNDIKPAFYEKSLDLSQYFDGGEDSEIVIQADD